MKSWNRYLLPALLAFMLPAVLLAQSDSDAVVGTWVLNLAKSSYKPGPAPQSETRTYESTPDGIHVTVHLVAADGTASTQTSTYKLDGKPYAWTGSPIMDSISVTRIKPGERRSTLRLNGQVVGHTTFVTSKDGKTMTSTRVLKDATGKTQRDVRVYDRQ